MYFLLQEKLIMSGACDNCRAKISHESRTVTRDNCFTCILHVK